MYEPLFARFLPDVMKDVGEERKVLCPFHDEEHPSFAVNVETGLWHCFGCGVGGKMEDFYRIVMAVSDNEAEDTLLAYIKGEEVPGPIAPSVVEDLQRRLMQDAHALRFLQERGIANETLDDYSVGAKGDFIALPVFSSAGYIVNIRLHGYGKGKRKLSWETGRGSIRFYPNDDFEGVDTIVLCEGELDALLARQFNIPAWSSTGGALGLPSNALDKLAGKQVILIYDADSAGAAGARKAVQTLALSKTFVITLPEVTPGYDVTNIINDPEYGSGWLLKRIHDVIKSKPTQRHEAEYVNLFSAREAGNISKPMRTDVKVIGKVLSPYDVPTEILATCGRGDKSKPKCKRCKLFANGGELMWTADAISDQPADMLTMIKCTTALQQKAIKSLLGIPVTCEEPQLHPRAHQTIEEIFVIPSIEWNPELNASYTKQQAFFLGYGLLPNISYSMTGLRITEPWRQTATFLWTKADPLKGALDEFKVTPDVLKQLKQFAANTGSLLNKAVVRMSAHIENVTKIFGRRDLVEAAMLTFASVLSFEFNRAPVDRGWIELLVLGDTGTGKTEFFKRLVRYLRLGDMAMAENSTFAGLVGGLQKLGDTYEITWGKIPQNDRQLLVIDEMSGLEIGHIAQMSGIRTSGIAELTKIQGGMTQARTRLVWISNPRTGNPLLSYAYGVQAVRELFGKMEDVSRIDFVVSAALPEVPAEEINRPFEETNLVRYTADDMRTLIMWAWSRKPEQIHFTPETVKTILHHAIHMGKTYSMEVPLVASAYQRVKLARLAAAYAVLGFSSPDGETLVVHPYHAERAVTFLHSCYEKPSLDYLGFSMARSGIHADAESEERRMESMFSRHPAVCEAIMQMDMFAATDIQTVVSLDREEVDDALADLHATRAVEFVAHHKFRKTAKFIMSYKRRLQNVGS